MCKVLSNVGRFKMFKRTEGVSTTDIVGKLLLLTKIARKYRKNGSFGKLRKLCYPDKSSG